MLENIINIHIIFCVNFKKNEVKMESFGWPTFFDDDEACFAHDHGTAKYPYFRMESTRLKSYIDWPKQLKQKREQLADAGFFYTKLADRVVCFNCGLGLRAWEDDDDPWEQHIHFSPNCEYVVLVKGREYINEVQRKFADKDIAESMHEKKNLKLEQLDEDEENCCDKWNEKLHQWRLCKICFENEYNTAFLPCGHIIACAKCACALLHCPNCRISLEKTVRVYFP